MNALTRDLRFVVRALARTPGFVLVTVATLALGIGATTAIFSVVHGVLLRPLAYPNADRIVQIWQIGQEGGQMQLSDPNFADLRTESRSFVALAEVSSNGVTSVAGATQPVRAQLAVVSREFFTSLGVQPVLGRAFLSEEQQVGASPAVIVSYGFWQRALGASPAALGRTLTFAGGTFRVVGVMPAFLDFPAGADLWVPRELDPPLPARTAHNWQVIGRLRDGVTVAQAQREVSAIARSLKQRYGDETWMVDAAVVPLREQIVGNARRALLVLLAASGVLLLIACANVVNLLVARMAARQGEVALRLALGAGRGRLIQQFLTESLVLSLAGAVIGVALAAVGVRVLLSLEPGRLPRLGEIGLHWPVLLFALTVSVVSAVALGLLTAWRSTRGDLRESLAQAQRTQAGVGASYRVRGGLVVAQVALTLVLLVGAGLLGRSFLRLLAVDPGFRAEHAIVLDLSVPSAGDSAGMKTTVRVHDQLIERLSGIPGVTAVGGTNSFPLANANVGNGAFIILSRPDEPIDFRALPQLLKDRTRSGYAEFRVASPGYFRALGIPVVKGRLFDDRDEPAAPPAAVISASLARTQWPNEDPIGKIIQFGNMDGDLRPFTIVGIVGDVRERSLAAEPRPTFYAFYRQRPRRANDFFYVMRTASAPATIIAAARRAVQETRPDIPPRFRTIETVLAESLADRRFTLLLIGVFGGAALLLATLGVYSVIAYLVAQRRQEIGVRVALGARSQDVLRLVLRQGALLALIGIGVGAIAALGLSRLLTGLLYGISATDPLAFIGVVVLLTAVALIASFVPARRASKVDPMTVLRGS